MPSCISKGQASGSASDTGVRGRMEGGGEDYGDVLDEDRAAALFEKPLEVLSRTLPLRPASTLGPIGSYWWAGVHAATQR